jgi:fructosamine-3-kinase
MQPPEIIITKVLDSINKINPGLNHQILSIIPVSGGSINEAFKLKTRSGNYFLKYNHAGRYPAMFEKEARGLQLLANAAIIQVPEVIQYGEAGAYAFLLLQYIESANEAPRFWDDFGEKLAKLHAVKSNKFGLDHDNYMGSLHQYNGLHDRWVEFFISERLERQVKLARENAAIESTDAKSFERLYKRLDEIFPPATPSLLHGDLWSGNFMTGADGKACLIDPAVYFGHPEIDIAMTTLFGGFSSAFYEAYNRHHPMEKGWQQRLDYYNLYPLMVHVNLFGSSYLGSVRRILKRF